MPPKAKKGKENAPPKKKVEEVIADDFDDMDVDAEAVKPKSKTSRPLKSKVVADDNVEEEDDVPSKSSAKSDTGVLARLAAITAERDRVIKERDTYAKQFEELSRLRHSSQETLLEKFKTQTAAVAKAQEDVIANQAALNENLRLKVSELEKSLAAAVSAAEKAEERAAAAAAPPVLEGKLDGKSSKELRDEVFKLRNTLKSTEEELTTVQREYAQEVAHSRKLQEARPSVPIAPSVPPAVASEESELDQLSLAFYEDLTGLSILKVNVKNGPAGKENHFRCVQTLNERSYGFRIRSFNEFDREAKKWTKQFELVPEGMQDEVDKKFVARLGPFASGFVVPRDQAASAWEQLRSRMSPDGVYRDPS